MFAEICGLIIVAMIVNDVMMSVTVMRDAR
jgi:hypothetical protein